MLGCVDSMTQATATEKELCRQWRVSLATRSHNDTPETKASIQESYARYELSCLK